MLKHNKRPLPTPEQAWAPCSGVPTSIIDELLTLRYFVSSNKKQTQNNQNIIINFCTFIIDVILILFCFKIGSCCIVQLALGSLCTPDWCWTHDDPPTSTGTIVLKLQSCTSPIDFLFLRWDLAVLFKLVSNSWIYVSSHFWFLNNEDYST